MDILFAVAPLPAGQGVSWLPQMMILLKRLLEAEYLTVHKPGGSMEVMGVDLTPNVLTLSTKGRAFLADLGAREL